MTVKFIPPRDPNELRLKQIEDAITQVLNNHIHGRGRDTKIKLAVSDVILALRPLLKIAPAPSKGATVMTESASRNEGGGFTKGPQSL